MLRKIRDSEQVQVAIGGNWRVRDLFNQGPYQI